MPTKLSITNMPLSQIEEKYGVKARLGTLVRVGKKYQFKVDGKSWELDSSMLISSKPIDRAVGTGTAAGGIIIDGRVAVIVLIHHPIWIICYIPVPDIFRRINDRIRIQVIDAMVREKALPAALAGDLKADMPRVR